MKHKCPKCGEVFDDKPPIGPNDIPSTDSEPETKREDDDDGLGLVTGMGIVAAETGLFSGNDSTPDISTPDTPSSFDSGGGDMGGGGAGSDY